MQKLRAWWAWAFTPHRRDYENYGDGSSGITVRDMMRKQELRESTKEDGASE
jgi:hypothetical protein